MRFIDLRHLSGPNVFSASPVAIARLEPDELTDDGLRWLPQPASSVAAGTS